MFNILPIKLKIKKIVKKHQLENKTSKQLKLLAQNPKHPSLNLELLEPKKYGIYSIRIDKKYRALLFFHPNCKTIEILTITLHYQ